MKTVKFYGASDDCIEIEGAFSHEAGAWEECVNFRISSPASQSRMRVFGVFSPGYGTSWVFGVGLVDDGDELPPWPIRFSRQHEYSVALEIDIPDDATLSIESLNGKLTEVTP